MLAKTLSLQTNSSTIKLEKTRAETGLSAKLLAKSKQHDVWTLGMPSDRTLRAVYHSFCAHSLTRPSNGAEALERSICCCFIVFGNIKIQDNPIFSKINIVTESSSSHQKGSRWSKPSFLGGCVCFTSLWTAARVCESPCRILRHLGPRLNLCQRVNAIPSVEQRGTSMRIPLRRTRNKAGARAPPHPLSSFP